MKLSKIIARDRVYGTDWPVTLTVEKIGPSKWQVARVCNGICTSRSSFTTLRAAMGYYESAQSIADPCVYPDEYCQHIGCKKYGTVDAPLACDHCGARLCPAHAHAHKCRTARTEVIA